MGQGSDGTDLCALAAASHDVPAQLTPGDELGEAVPDLFQGFGVQGLDSLWGLGRGVGPISNGSIELFQGPVVHDFHGAAVIGVVLEQGTSSVAVGKLARTHEASPRLITIVLTLCFRENVK